MRSFFQTPAILAVDPTSSGDCATVLKIRLFNLSCSHCGIQIWEKDVAFIPGWNKQALSATDDIKSPLNTNESANWVCLQIFCREKTQQRLTDSVKASNEPTYLIKHHHVIHQLDLSQIIFGSSNLPFLASAQPVTKHQPALQSPRSKIARVSPSNSWWFWMAPLLTLLWCQSVIISGISQVPGQVKDQRWKSLKIQDELDQDLRIAPNNSLLWKGI